MQQQSRPPHIHTMCEEKRGDLGGIRPEFGLFWAWLKWAPKPSCPVLTGWHHHLLISSRSFHRLMDKAVGQGSGWLWVLGPVVRCWGCVYSSLSLSSTPSTASVAILDPARGKGGKKTCGQKENRRKRWGRGEGRSDELSVAWEEGRAQGYDWLQAGSEFKANAQAPALCNGGRKGDVGHREGAANKKGRSWWKKVVKKKRGEKEKKNTLWKDSATKCPDLCGSLFLQMLAINYKTHHGAHTHTHTWNMFFSLLGLKLLVHIRKGSYVLHIIYRKKVN